MQYRMISADCHIDLIWLPPDLFTANASAAMKDRMPYVTDGERGPVWVSKRGAAFGLQNGMGSAGARVHPRSDPPLRPNGSDESLRGRKKGIRRLTDPDLRIKDQDLDGIQAECCTASSVPASDLATQRRQWK